MSFKTAEDGCTESDQRVLLTCALGKSDDSTLSSAVAWGIICLSQGLVQRWCFLRASSRRPIRKLIVDYLHYTRAFDKSKDR